MLTTLINKIRMELYALKQGINTSFRKAAGRSDYERWGKKESLLQNWDARTRRIAGLIQPGQSVLEFGAGRMALKAFLPERCAYTPCDLVDRGDGTIVCDLNGTLPSFRRHDVAVFSGVLEYVNDLPRLIDHLSGCVDGIVASYAILEKNETDRRVHGWVNDYSASEFVIVFEKAGFQCNHTEAWGTQVIYQFTRGK
ncbi:MAG: class I SAM-dependent methyltransferase [Nitrospirae bacterium]|nr:class I SAM-dependent methyltransferase [Candidatus Manganitrophaceae bacterium]